MPADEGLGEADVVDELGHRGRPGPSSTDQHLGGIALRIALQVPADRFGGNDGTEAAPSVMIWAEPETVFQRVALSWMCWLSASGWPKAWRWSSPSPRTPSRP